MDYKLDRKIEAILYKVDIVKDNFPNFSNVWREYLIQKINNLNKQIDRLDALINNISNIDNDIPIFLLFMLINN